MTIPKEVKTILTNLQKAGFEAYIVGGCVRDFLLGIEPKDWDVTTNATPEEIQKIFPESIYENDFLTVMVKTGHEKFPIIEVTTYRTESQYSNKRHPDAVQVAKNLQEDTSRRDFTINAMAMNEKKQVLDFFEGKKDLERKVIKTVGDADERFSEDALRMLRAIRFAATLGFSIEEKTLEAIKKHAKWIEAISKERVKDEVVKIIMSEKAADGIELLHQVGLLAFILPELEENYGVTQNKHHIYDCYQHALKALEYTAQKKYSLDVRLAALFHDIGKPKVKAGDGINSTFYNHEMVGAKMAFAILKRLTFSNKDIEKIVTLIRYHMFYYNTDEVTESSVRRLIKNVGPENIAELLQLREADRIGSGVPKAEPYKLRHLKYIIDKVSKDPISVGMLKVDGQDIMKLLEITPGPKIGQILDVLLGKVLDDPKLNTKAKLEKEIKALNELPEKELLAMASAAKEDKFEAQKEEDQSIKEKYWVK